MRFIGLISSSNGVGQALLPFDIGSVGITINTICCNLTINDPTPNSKAHKALFIKLLCTSSIELIIAIILIDLKILLVWAILSICQTVLPDCKLRLGSFSVNKLVKLVEVTCWDVSPRVFLCFQVYSSTPHVELL